MAHRDYHPTTDHTTCYFVSGEWDEPIPRSALWLLICRLFRVKVKVRRWRRQTGNDVIDVHPLVHSIDMQPQRKGYCVTSSMVISRKLHDWTVRIMNIPEPESPELEPESVATPPKETL